jgi:hypothetical protein
LAGGTDRHVLGGRRHLDLDAEEVGGDRLHGARCGRAADQEDPAHRHALRAERPESVGEAAQHALDGGARQVGGAHVGSRHAEQ